MPDARGPGEGAPTGAPIERRLLAVAALLSAAVSLGVFALPLQLAALGARDGALLGWSGLAFGAGVGVSALATPVWGALGDRFGRRAMLLRAALGLALSQALLALAGTPGDVVLGRLVQGALSGAMPAVMALGSALPGERVVRFGRLESAGPAGALAAPVLGAGLIGLAGPAAAYVGAAVLAALAGLVALALPEAHRRGEGRPGGARALLAVPAVRGLLAVALVVEAAQQLVELAWPVLVVRLAPDPALQAAVLAAVDVVGEGAYLVAAPWLGARAAAHGTALVARGCLLVSAAAAAVAPMLPSAWLLVPAAAGSDGAAAGIHPLLQDLLCEAAGEDAESAVLGLAASALRVGSLAGSALAPLAAVVGLPIAVGGAAVVLATCALGLRPVAAPTPPVPG